MEDSSGSASGLCLLCPSIAGGATRGGSRYTSSRRAPTLRRYPRGPRGGPGQLAARRVDALHAAEAADEDEAGGPRAEAADAGGDLVVEAGAEIALIRLEEEGDDGAEVLCLAIVVENGGELAGWEVQNSSGSRRQLPPHAVAR